MAMAAMERIACALVTVGVAAGASKAQMFAITAAAMNSISMEARAASSIDASVVARGAAVMEQLSLQAALSRTLGKDFCSAAAAVAEARSSGLLSGHAANAAQGVIELGNTAKYVGLGTGMQLLEAVASKRAERRARRSRQRVAEPVASRGTALGSDEAASTDDYGASTCRAPEASVPCPPLQHLTVAAVAQSHSMLVCFRASTPVLQPLARPRRSTIPAMSIPVLVRTVQAGMLRRDALQGQGWAVTFAAAPCQRQHRHRTAVASRSFTAGATTACKLVSTRASNQPACQ